MTFQLGPFPWHAGGDCEGGDFGREGLGLEGFRVWSYRSVRDSGYVPLSAVTALVGREQSGKTTLLQALWGLDPRIEAPFSAQRDWPRGQKPRANGEQVACAAKLRFQGSFRDELVNLRWIDPSAVGVHLGRTFRNKFCISVLDQAAFDAPLKGHSSEWTQATPEVQRQILDRMPKLIYSPADWILPDRFASAELEQWIAGPDAAAGGPGQDTSLAKSAALRALAALAQDHAAAPGEGVVGRINGKLAGFRLAETLRLTSVRGQIRVLVQSGSAWRELRLLSPARRYLVTLDLRIAAAREAGGPAPVLLLDGPGRAFKGGLKQQLRGSLARYAAAGIRVIYTARLPFHVELQHPEQVLVLAPNETSRGTLCQGHVRAGPLTLHAALGMQGRSSFRIDDVNLVVEGPTDAGILRALSRLFADSGQPSLPADLNVISAGGAFEVASVSAFLARQGLGVVALFDSDAAGVAGLHQLEGYSHDGTLWQPVKAFLLGDAAQLGVEDATIEDLFPPAEYLAALRSMADDPAKRVLDGANGPTELGRRFQMARHLRRLYEARGWRFPKMEVAQVLEQRIASNTSVDDLLPGFRSSAQVLLDCLRSAIRSQYPKAVAPPLT